MINHLAKIAIFHNLMLSKVHSSMCLAAIQISASFPRIMNSLNSLHGSYTIMIVRENFLFVEHSFSLFKRCLSILVVFNLKNNSSLLVPHFIHRIASLLFENLIVAVGDICGRFSVTVEQLNTKIRLLKSPCRLILLITC